MNAEELRDAIVARIGTFEPLAVDEEAETPLGGPSAPAVGLDAGPADSVDACDPARRRSGCAHADIPSSWQRLSGFSTSTSRKPAHSPRRPSRTPSTAAAPFFAEHFPDQHVETAICASWLLDPYLAEHLAPTSNIVSFQRQFTPYGDLRDDELDALYFTFGTRSLDGLDKLPRRSSLQRVVLDRLDAGGRWHVAHGYRPLSPRNPNAP